MKIYNVLWHDRHSDTTATPFLDLDRAKKWAKESAKSVCSHREMLKETFIESWLYHIEYGEDCYIWITEHDI